MIRSKERIIPYRLTTAEIVYHMPDHPNVLQNFIWQGLDIDPDYPVLHGFLRFWQDNIEGRLHTVTIAATSLVKPGELRFAQSLLHIH